jgi:predicted component of type VI protein secretion system
MKQPSEKIWTQEELEKLCPDNPPPASLLRRLEIRRQRKAAAQRQALLAPVSEKMAAAINTNPDSLRLAAQSAEGVTVIERPDQRRLPSRVVVVEVDADGRPALVKQLDGFVQYEGGYSPSAGAKHVYNPLDGLRGNDE